MVSDGHSAVDAPMADGDDELMDAEQVAALLGMTVGWVYEQSRRGRIPTITLGRYRRYRRGAIQAWLLSIERASVATLRKTAGRRWHAPGPATKE
jgi:excisionase family DNA binding protein